MQSKRGIAKAIRVLRDSRNFPVLVHCIHGKDRTGLLVMLILLLCDIPPAVCPCHLPPDSYVLIEHGPSPSFIRKLQPRLPPARQLICPQAWSVS